MSCNAREGLSDRQAADAVRGRLEWKYLLGLEVDDPGFDASVLVEFRQRLLTSKEECLLFDVFLTKLREHGYLKTRGHQRDLLHPCAGEGAFAGSRGSRGRNLSSHFE